MRIIAIGLILALFATACGSGDKPSKGEQILQAVDSAAQNQADPITSEVIGDVLQRIPSPLEISVLLKETGKKYNASLLNSTDNASRYNSNYKKALNLGVYGTDLGYTNIYEQNQDGVKYMATIKELADDLNIGQFFDLETVGRLATNSKNLDSLLLITTQNFNSINNYLHQENRSNLSVLLLTGGWLEALHVVCEVAKANPENKDLMETIGGQKIILENIMLLLSFYKDSDQNMALLLTDMEQLKQAFDKVNITYTYKESTVEVIDGVMYIKDNSTSTINITPEDLKSIGSITENIRTKVIS
jgi:hypothetical protein